MLMRKVLLFVFFATFVLFESNAQTVLSKWTFEGVTTSSTAATTPTITLGSSSADAGVLTSSSVFSASHASASAVWSQPSGNGSQRAMSANNWAVNDYWQFQFATTNFGSISITWDVNGSNTGPRDFKVQYSTDGSSFTDATGTNSTYQITSVTWSTNTVNNTTRFTLNLSSVTALNNVSAVYIRLVQTSTTSISGSTVGTGGTSRVDNFTVTGTYTGTTTNYYSKSSGNLDVLSTWGTNTDGTGSNPSDFVSAGQVFNIRNNATATLSSSWTVSGTGSKVIVGDGTNPCQFTIPSSTTLNSPIEISTTGTLVVAPGGAIGNYNYINNSGNITLQQSFVGQRGWRVLANPFTTATTIATTASNNNITIGTTASGASGLTDSRTFSNSSNTWSNVTGTTWIGNTPYGLFYRGLNGEVTGSIYSGGPSALTYKVGGNATMNTASVTQTVSSASNFLLVGNPYAAPVNTQALTGGSAKPYYTYRITQGGTQSAQQTLAGAWVASSGNSSTSVTIPVLGTLIYTPSTTNPYLISTSDINVGGTNETNLFGVSKPINQLELVINKNGDFQDKLFIRADNTATNSAKDEMDLPKFYNDNVNFYTINKNEDVRLAVDARKDFNTTIPLGISGTAGSYVLNVANNNLEDITIYLKDKLNNTQTELTPATNYNFNITADAATKGEGRFELLFVSKATATLPATTSGGFTAKLLGNVITNNQPIQVQVQNASANAVIQVKDVNGRAIATQAAINGLNTINVSRASLGMYIVQTTDGNNIVTDKVIKQ